MQNTADAAALAGVAELPSQPHAAIAKAKTWVAKNGVPASQIKTIEVRTTDAPNDTLHVEVEKDFSWIFRSRIGQRDRPCFSQRSRPDQFLTWNQQSDALGYRNGRLGLPRQHGKSDPGNRLFGQARVRCESTTGWYGALDLDGSGGGSSEYESNIIDGTAETKYCSVGETDPECDSFKVDALDGNKVGGTDHAIDERLLAEPTAGCDANGNGSDDFGEVFVPSESDAAQYGVACPQSPRLIVIPIVTVEGIPMKTVAIEDWALAYLDGYNCIAVDCPSGKGHWEVEITMVDAIYSQPADLIGDFNPLSDVAVLRLIE